MLPWHWLLPYLIKICRFFLLELLFIICWLLHPDPRWRATIKDVEENDWINQPVDVTKYSFDAVLGQFSSRICFIFNKLLSVQPSDE